MAGGVLARRLGRAARAWRLSLRSWSLPAGRLPLRLRSAHSARAGGLPRAAGAATIRLTARQRRQSGNQKRNRCLLAAAAACAAACSKQRAAAPHHATLQTGVTLALPTHESAELELTECGPSCACFGGCELGFSSGGGAAYPPVSLQQRPGKGWGVLADEPLPAGTVLCHYAGEYVSNAEAQRRLAEYDAAGGGHALLVRGGGRAFQPTSNACNFSQARAPGTIYGGTALLKHPPRPSSTALHRCCVSGCPAAQRRCG